MQNFYDFFVKELKDIYNSELQILKALPKMAKAAKSPKLKQAFLSHLEETKGQVKRLEKVGKLMKESLKGEVCKAMHGLLEEGEEILKTAFEKDTKDAALISAAQRVEHYEMAAYGCLKTYAKHLKMKEVEKLLKETLKEEGAADKKLTTIAEGGTFTTGVNTKACDHC